MKYSRVTTALYLALVFLSGGAVGSFAMWMHTSRSVAATSGGRPSPEEYRKRYLDEMNARLKLSPEQLRSLNGVLDQTRALYKQVFDKHRPEYKAIQDHQVEQIRAILDEPQRTEYEKIRAEREKRKPRAPYGY